MGPDEDGRTAGTANEALAWETTESAVVYSCPGFDVNHDEVRYPDGTAGEFDYVAEPPAVVVLPFTPDGEVVVIEEWRQAVGRVNRGLPAGTREPDDADLASAARRELREETGYRAETLRHRFTVEPANGIANSVHHHFVATGCTPAGGQRLDHDEHIRVETTSIDELVAAIGDDDLRDGRAVTAVLYHVIEDRP